MQPIALSIPETGKVLGGEAEPLSRNTIYRMMERGELDKRKLGGRTLITMSSIRRAIGEPA
jgi:hypothetical protein